MAPKHFVVIGAGEVGFHLAQSLSQGGGNVVLIEEDPRKQEWTEEQLDVSVVTGNGAHVPTLEAARAQEAELVLAVTSNDEVNLVASLLAKRMGAARTIVRVRVAEDIISHRKIYSKAFQVDLLLSTQLLTTVRILDEIRGHNTVAVEYLAGGRVQLRKIQLDSESILTQRPLKDVKLPRDTLVVAFFHGKELTIPAGQDRAEPGDEALILATSEMIGKVHRLVTSRPEWIGKVVLAGGGETGATVARVLEGLTNDVKIIEQSRERAEELSASFPRFEVIHGNATDPSLLRAERVGDARCFVALSGQDESNLMASLLAQEMGVPQVITLVERSETVNLWRRVGPLQVVSPKLLAYEHIRDYVESDYSAQIVSLQRGAALVVERQLAPASPAAGVTLAEMSPPPGLIVGAVVRERRVFVPRGADRLEVGDTVILFVKEEELDTVRLLFPGSDE